MLGGGELGGGLPLPSKWNQVREQVFTVTDIRISATVIRSKVVDF